MACYQGIGLDEKLISHATEKSGMLLVQVERSIRVPSSVVQQGMMVLKFYFLNLYTFLESFTKILKEDSQVICAAGRTAAIATRISDSEIANSDYSGTDFWRLFAELVSNASLWLLHVKI